MHRTFSTPLKRSDAERWQLIAERQKANAIIIISAIKRLCFEPKHRNARLKKFRLLLMHVMGRMNRNKCAMGPRMQASPETIRRMQKVWEMFELPTQATASVTLGRGGGG